MKKQSLNRIYQFECHDQAQNENIDKKKEGKKNYEQSLRITNNI